MWRVSMITKKLPEAPRVLRSDIIVLFSATFSIPTYHTISLCCRCGRIKHGAAEGGSRCCSTSSATRQFDSGCCGCDGFRSNDVISSQISAKCRRIRTPGPDETTNRQIDRWACTVLEMFSYAMGTQTDI